MPAASARGALAKPYRIAFLTPEIAIEGADAVHAREAAALVWMACIELLQRHPGVSVLDAEVTPLVPQDGHYAPAGADRGAAPLDAVFGPTRRDELLWLELTLAPGGKPGVVRLHGLARDGAAQSFEALGRALGEQLQQVFAAWLAARGLSTAALPRTLEPLSADEALAVVRAIAPLLAEQARVGGVAVRAVRHAGPYDARDEEEAPSAPAPLDDELELEPEPDAGSTAVQMELHDALILEELSTHPATTISGRPRAIANRLPAALRVTAMRLLELTLGDDLGELVLANDPDHPQALFARYLAASAPDRAELRRVLASAPGWAPPYAELAVDDEPPLPGDASPASPPTALEAIAATGIAAVCRPASLAALQAAAGRLADDGRIDEGVRLLERTVELHGELPDAHIALVDLLARADREGARLERAQAAARRHGCPLTASRPWYPDQIRVDLRASTALLGVGRHAEAIALRAARLEGREAQWPSFAATLGAWRKDPRYLAWSYAREGAYRGDDPRTLEGFGRAAPDDAVDLALFLDALVALGREDEAQLAWTQLGLGAGHHEPAARLAAARALLSAGEWRRGLDEMWRVELTSPGRDDQVAIARCGLVLSVAPIDAIEAALAERLAIGAPTLARRMARDAADFVPGAAKSSVIARALGKPAEFEFDAAWLAGFAADTRSKAAIDALFLELGPARASAPRPRARAGAPVVDAGGSGSSNELARADRLVNRWLEAVFAEAAEDDAPAIAQAAAYAAAQALARYLAMTTQAPSVHAGALRTVAAEALALVRRHRHALGDRDARALLGAIDPPLRRADRWVGGAWLGTCERSLGLDERAAGDVAAFAQPHATAASRVLGPEETAVLAWSVARLQRDRPEGWAAACAAQAQRLALHTGRAGADEWAAAVVAQLAGRAIEVDDALDALHVACYLAEGKSPVPCVHTARVLFEAGRAPAAVAVLSAGLASATPRWRDAHVAELEPLWGAAKLEVPFAFPQVATGVFAALQAREPARAEKLARWAVAYDPTNAEAHRNLGLALAQQGKLGDAMVHLVRGTGEQAAQILAGVLSQRDKLPDAVAVLDYASRWYVRAEQWLTFGGIAYTAMDNARTVRGYATAWQLDPDAFDPTQLNAYASVLDEVGDYETCALIAERLHAAANGEALWLSSAANHLACARIGQGRFDEAITLAAEAVATNPLADNTAGFAMTLSRARTHQVATPVAAGEVDARGRLREPVFALIEAGEHAAAAAIVHAPLASWRVRRAALGATRFRAPAENQVAVTARARAAALAVLADTVGLVDRDAVIARAVALEIREQAYFARDPVPPLGARLTREAFHAELRARGGVVLGGPPEAAPVFVDRVVVTGGKIARASDYIALLRDLAAIDPREAIAQFSLDEAGFFEIACAWSAALDADPTLAALIAAGLARGPTRA